MARGDAKDLFFRKLRIAGLSKPAVETLATRLDALEAADSTASSAWTVVVSTAAHVVADDHQRIFCSAAATTDVTAPAPGGKVFMVTNTGTTGNVTVLPHAAETVNRAASYAVAPGASLTLADDNANWWGI